MDIRDDIREFLTTRRARLTPDQVGLPDFGGRRRVPGLRREEVALVAGMSVEYYVRLERGNAAGVSESVLEGIGRALQLDDAEQAHLYDLVRTANQGARPRRRHGPARPLQVQVRPSVQHLLDTMENVPVIVQNGRLDAVATNQLGRALFSPLFDRTPLDHTPAGQRHDHREPPENLARFVFLDPGAQEFFRDWDDTAQQTVAILRTEAGRAPYDRALSDLVGELSTRSDAFRTLWASHDVRAHQTGRKNVHHPVVGDLDLTYEAMTLASEPGLMLIAYGTEPGSASGDALRVLASWAATSRWEADGAASGPADKTAGKSVSGAGESGDKRAG
ncbi:helix-turn-helix transcriptional regulator [Promicromonospora sp. NPDC057138]|uniref:helix-turn-helix transcriptional regulator n=1 Tax=Promicromonospora sp. NPDC057138 TaxID=3346031 RepID=UPI00362FF966